MNTKLLFPQDKNYILKEAQDNCRQDLLQWLAESVRSVYLSRHNPLGLQDDTVQKIEACKSFQLTSLQNFYYELAAIYRYKIGSNQLEFIFSGKSHYDKYLDDWREAFELWAEDFMTSPYFLKAMLEITILNSPQHTAFLASNRLKVYLSQYFNLRVYKYRGIQPIQPIQAA